MSADVHVVDMPLGISFCATSVAAAIDMLAARVGELQVVEVLVPPDFLFEATKMAREVNTACIGVFVQPLIAWQWHDSTQWGVRAHGVMVHNKGFS